jgi:adenylate cyclase
LATLRQFPPVKDFQFEREAGRRVSHVFISYARSTEEQATQVEKALREAGYGVWRDAELPAHRAYADVIEERLKAANAVVVLWSAEAVKSQWVRAEADAARELGTLIQASVDGTVPPMPFNQIQCADLKNWDGKDESIGWRKLRSSVETLAGPVQAKAAKPGRASARQLSVCVLPFQNMSGDAEQEYFSDGISEDITTDLSKVSALEVIARNTAFQFKGQSVDVSDVARKLGVTHVLEGSVRKAGNRVRITAQLIDGASGGHVWAERFDRDLTDIFAIQDEISKAIVDALKVKLLPAEKKAIEQRGTANVDAYNYYLMARDHWATGNHGDVHREERVIRLCERAVEIDPDYANAWALLAIAQSSRHHGFGWPGDDGAAAAEKALSIDPTIAEAHCPIIRRHIERHEYAEAEATLARALIADPDSWEVNHEGTRLHVRQRHLKEAAEHLEKEVSVMESDYYGWGMLLTCKHALGDSAEAQRVATKALTEAEKALEHDPNSGAALAVAARARATLGDVQGAMALVDRGLLLDPDNLNMRYNFGSMYAAQFNDPEAAFAFIGPAIAKASGSLIRWVEIDPDVDSLRSDPRFDSMVAEAKARVQRNAEQSATPPAAS